jgi:organic hydroperoxide reductase OsmC/OhrA
MRRASRWCSRSSSERPAHHPNASLPARVCVLDEVQEAPRITEVALTVRARVEALDEAAFKGAVDKAAALCPVSNALRGNVEISVDAAL